MRIALLALTGMGNEVLKVLAGHPAVADVLVCTRKEKGAFPYYDCEPLGALCRRMGIPAHTGLDAAGLRRELEAARPDMILAATFHLRLPGDVLDLPPRGAVNIHPSLLPLYRGPTPTHWALIRGERESGVTFHRMSADYDRGDILCQEKMSITGLTDGALREALARLAGKMLHKFLPMYLNGACSVRPQADEEGGYFPRLTSEEGIALLKTGRFDRQNLIRGLTPYPGTQILE